MMTVMFLVGTIIFGLYLFGLLYAVYWGHSSQRKEMEEDPELRNYYSRHGMDMDYDGIGNQGRVPSYKKEKKTKNRKFKERVR
jgi:hypothetical protein